MIETIALIIVFGLTTLSVILVGLAVRATINNYGSIYVVESK